jgi:hypothetical protein
MQVSFTALWANARSYRAGAAQKLIDIPGESRKSGVALTTLRTFS